MQVGPQGSPRVLTGLRPPGQMPSVGGPRTALEAPGPSCLTEPPASASERDLGPHVPRSSLSLTRTALAPLLPALSGEMRGRSSVGLLWWRSHAKAAAAMRRLHTRAGLVNSATGQMAGKLHAQRASRACQGLRSPPPTLCSLSGLFNCRQASHQIPPPQQGWLGGPLPPAAVPVLPSAGSAPPKCCPVLLPVGQYVCQIQQDSSPYLCHQAKAPAFPGSNTIITPAEEASAQCQGGRTGQPVPA